jgi:N-acylneuraminate cytidylyltransferase
MKDKNFRPFYEGNSLCDIQIEKLLAVLHPRDIYVSSEDAAREAIAEKWNVNFILRDIALTYNTTPIVQVIRGVCAQVPGDDDIMWCQVIDPLFNAYRECIDIWDSLDRNAYDSLVVVYPFRHYILNEQFQPQGFGFGLWHRISQLLPNMYQLTFTLSILKRESIRDIGYYVGARPYWFVANNVTLDIDSEEEFEVASITYGKFFKKR